VKRIISKILLLLSLLGMLASAFSLQPAEANGAIYIHADGDISPSGAPVSSLDNVTYTFIGTITDCIIIERNNIIVDGAGYTVEGNGSGNGFSLNGISNVTIKNASIKGFTYGIYLESTSYNIISGNNITTSNYDGIGLHDSSNNVICGNRIMSNNWFGIGLYYSSDNSIFCNRLENNFDGIRLHYSSYNSISRNYVVNNSNGIGVYDSSNNSMFHNNFASNTLQAFSWSSFNIWDNNYPSGGNYWGNYNGVDMMSGSCQNETGSDGVGDTPYPIDESNVDRYPLMDPWALQVHDISVVEVEPSPSRIYAGQIVDIQATIRNEGRETDTFEVLGRCEGSRIGTVSVSDLTAWQQVVVTLKFDTILLAPGRSYLISVEVEPVDGEDMLENNVKTITVKVNLMGDVNGDDSVNILDVSIGARAFGTEPGHERWNPDADMNLDNKINVIDITMVAKEFGKSA
jgi:parallel beta-helix repeat protein